MGYMVEVTLDDFDDWSILEAAEDIIGCYHYKEGSKEEKLLRKMHKHLCEMFDEEAHVNPESFVDPSTAADIVDEIDLKIHVEKSKDFKFFADI
jgi:hypothetical protein